MMDLSITKDEQNAFKKYINEKYETINQMLVSNSEADIALISDEVENHAVELEYDTENVKENLEIIKLIYSLILKQYYLSNPSETEFFRGSNLYEIERWKTEIYIDRLLSATKNKEDANDYSKDWNKSVRVNLKLDENIPYIYVKDIIKRHKNKNEVIILPFTKIKTFNEEEEEKGLRVYSIELEKQLLDGLKEKERKGLYSYIIDNAHLINKKLEECIKLEKENSVNFENIRKLEQLLVKHENSMDEKELSRQYSDIDRETDIDDIRRINKELDELKEVSTDLFEKRKQNINFVNMWKRNIAVYMIAECKEIEMEFAKCLEEKEEAAKGKLKKKDEKDEKRVEEKGKSKKKTSKKDKEDEEKVKTENETNKEELEHDEIKEENLEILDDAKIKVDGKIIEIADKLIRKGNAEKVKKREEVDEIQDVDGEQTITINGEVVKYTVDTETGDTIETVVEREQANTLEAEEIYEEDEELEEDDIELENDDEIEPNEAFKDTAEEIDKGEEIDSEEDISKEEVKDMEKFDDSTIVFRGVKLNIDEDKLLDRVKEESKENIEAVEKLIEDINNLIYKQQNHARIAGNMGATYSALNNAFEMRNSAEELLTLLNNINLKILALGSEERTIGIEEQLEKISKNCIDISTLLNYLNNPKIAVRDGNATRFDELYIIEENELKRRISERIRNICGEAELKKLKDDLEIIQDKSAISKVIGLITGRNKLDEFMIEQIAIRQTAIRKTLSKKLSLAHNYSIHELMARITMFVNENDDDELVEQDTTDLKALAAELRKNYVIHEAKVQKIIEQKEGRNMPFDRRMSKREIIEIETYRFLNKYGYDNPYNGMNEPEYQDTMAHEIGRIVEYINSSKIL